MAAHPLQKWEPTFQILDGGGVRWDPIWIKRS
jgi:hypothetical protein